MKTMLCLLLSAFLFLGATPVLAQANPCTAQVYGDFSKELNWHCPLPNEDTMVPKLDIPHDTTPLTKGAPAPFDGLLLDQNRVLTLGMRITGLRRLLWIELKMAKAEEELEVARAREVAQADAANVAAQNQALTARNAQLEASLKVEQAWYRTWTFGFVLGAALTTTAAVSLAVVAR